MTNATCDNIQTTWTDEANLQLLRLLHDVEEGITDQADYLFLLHVVANYVADTCSLPRLVHRWARTNKISYSRELPNEQQVEKGVPS